MKGATARSQAAPAVLHTHGVEGTCGQIGQLGRLLAPKRKVPIGTDHWFGTQLAARRMSDRRTYADHSDAEMARAAGQVLQESDEGERHWLAHTDASPLGDASELAVSVVPHQESATHIFWVLKGRDEWLRLQELDATHDMDWYASGDFNTWCIEEFRNEPHDQTRDDANRAEGLV